MGLVDDIKKQISKAGANKGKLLYLKSGVKVRIRFLQEMDEGLKLLFHDSFEKGINVICQEHFDKECTHHEDEDLRHDYMYCWSVWDYEAKEVKLLLSRVNNCSPVPALVGLYEAYGTIKDRDYVITQSGSQTNKTFSVVPMDPVRFKNTEAKPLSETKVLNILNKAFPDETEEAETEEEFTKKKKTLPGKTPKKHKDEDEDEDLEDEEEDEEKDYSDMTPKELYEECKKRKLNVKIKQPKNYYIEKLESDDDSDDGWDDEEDED